MYSISIPNGLINDEVKYEKSAVHDFPEELFKLPTLASFVGERGKGKTNAATVLMASHIQRGYFTRIYCISPTYESNEVLHTLPIREEDIYKDFYSAGAAINDVIRKFQEDVKMFKNAKIYKKKYEEFEQYKLRGGAYSDVRKKDRDYMEGMQAKIAQMYMDLQSRMEYLEEKITEGDKELALKATFPNALNNPMMGHEQNDLMDIQNWPVFMFPYELVKPCPVLFIDDMSHSDIYSTSRVNPLVNLCLRHRHLGGAGFGITIYFAVQTFKTGVPKALRNNCQQFFIFEGSDFSVLENMYLEFAGLCTKKDFYEMYATAIGEDRPSHHFLTVDKNASHPDRVFRRDFHEFLIQPKKLSLREQMMQELGGKSQKREVEDHYDSTLDMYEDEEVEKEDGLQKKKKKRFY